MRLSRLSAAALGCVLLVTSAWSKVFVRWTSSELPSERLGAIELVIPFAPDKAFEIRDAAKQGYRVYIEVPLPHLADAEKLLRQYAVAGFIVKPGNAPDSAAQLQRLQAEYHKLKILSLSLIGKEPQMRGQTVTTKNGVLQVSSPTAQPWLDSNLAMVRFEQASNLGVTPVYSFAWELNDSLQQQYGPSADDYALAIAESGLLHADLELNLHPSLEKGLLANQADARAIWNKILCYMNFAAGNVSMTPWSNIVMSSNNYDAAYEPMNLMARHNIPFRVLPAMTASALKLSDVAVALSAPDQTSAEALNTFAQRGGTVIVVDAKGKYPWQSVDLVRNAEHVVSYTAGSGRVFELSEPISDPETFAEDVRRLTPKKDVLISLWNALTTMAVPYHDGGTGNVVVEMVNFAEEPMRIQVQLKGSYSSIRYETPDHGCCQELNPVKHDGFTDFIVPSLVICGRVHLISDRSGKNSR